MNTQPHADLVRLLGSMPYFARLDTDALAAVATRAVNQRYDRGQVLFLEGDPCAGLFFVGEGRIKLYKLSLEGKEQVVKLLGPGEFFNEVAVLDGGPNPVSAMAALDSTLWKIDRSAMLELLNTHSLLALAIIENLAGHARHLLSLVEDLSLRTVRARLAKLLLAEAEVESEGPHRMTQQDMAVQLGTVREMVGRVLHSFEDEGLIRFERHRIFVLDRDGLEREAMV